jgi:hypothetical protein
MPDGHCLFPHRRVLLKIFACQRAGIPAQFCIPGSLRNISRRELVRFVFGMGGEIFLFFLLDKVAALFYTFILFEQG